MLSTKSAAVVEATLPVIGAAIDEIARVFYQRMFAARPDLERDLFNRGNQAQGDQQSALAGAIAVYATLLVADDGRDPVEVLARIAHKHASLGINADQYQVVHDNLMWAIVDVLGDAVTPEVAEAWTEVYWLMADALIKLEKGLYAKQANDKMWLDWKVVSKEPTGNAAVTFRFEPADDTPQTPGEAGGFVSVRVKVADGLRQARQYSLSDHAASTTERVITVKLDEAGEVSPTLINAVEVGDVVELSNPYGEITPKDDSAPLMLATAGIGITPAASILSSLAEQGSDREVVVLHADASLESVALLGQLTESLSALPNAQAHLWLGVAPEQAPEGITVHEGRMDPSEIELPSGAEVILCGPLAFMQATRSALIDAGVPATGIRYEIFGPDLWLAV